MLHKLCGPYADNLLGPPSSGFRRGCRESGLVILMDAKNLIRLQLRSTATFRPLPPRRTWRHGSPQLKRQLSSTSSPCQRRTRGDSRRPSFSIVGACPNPTCDYIQTPSMPDGLAINHERALNGTMAAYSQQLVVCTGSSDWASRIEWDERETAWARLVKGVKSLLGRNGKFADVRLPHRMRSPNPTPGFAGRAC